MSPGVSSQGCAQWGESAYERICVWVLRDSQEKYAHPNTDGGISGR